MLILKVLYSLLKPTQHICTEIIIPIRQLTILSYILLADSQLLASLTVLVVVDNVTLVLNVTSKSCPAFTNVMSSI